MKNPLDISAIVPFAGEKSLLMKAVCSILDQSLSVSEIVIVNNSGFDLLESDFDFPMLPKIVIIASGKSRIGAAAARNIGLKHANSEYVAFLDDDDLWLPRKIEIQLKMMLSESLDLSTSDFLFQRGNRSSQLPNLSRGKVERQIYLRCHNGLGSTLMANKKAIIELGSFDEKLFRFEDWDLMIRMASSGFRYRHISRPLSMVMRNPNDNWMLAEDALKNVLAKHANLSSWKKAQFTSGYFYEKATIRLRTRNYQKTIYYAVLSISFWPPQLFYMVNRLRNKSIKGHLPN